MFVCFVSVFSILVSVWGGLEGALVDFNFGFASTARCSDFWHSETISVMSTSIAVVAVTVVRYVACTGHRTHLSLPLPGAFLAPLTGPRLK